ncbi:hypothetical protein DQ04_04681010 [Trypanosoma grayi]|uniref:hypothetical protein n=1 Tax=Trypanosoma grayi TaxID=71804 RepID=UPI0004F459CD|nr:hypothetical protein DQ04_04681010 [Trypanosoma grayi]KEG09770.1 hypothetical protein DQ04_04681010 [Trypanosoma grayi]
MRSLEVLCSLAREMGSASQALSLRDRRGDAQRSGSHSRSKNSGGNRDRLQKAEIIQHCLATLKCIKALLLLFDSKSEDTTTTADLSLDTLRFCGWQYVDLEHLQRELVSGEQKDTDDAMLVAALLNDTYVSWINCSRLLSETLCHDWAAVQTLGGGSSCFSNPYGLPLASRESRPDHAVDANVKPAEEKIRGKEREGWDSSEVPCNAAIKLPLLASQLWAPDVKAWLMPEGPAAQCHPFSGPAGLLDSSLYEWDKNDIDDSDELPTQSVELFSVATATKGTQAAPLEEERGLVVALNTSDEGKPSSTSPLIQGMTKTQKKKVPWKTRSQQVSRAPSLRHLVETVLTEDYGWSNLQLKVHEVRLEQATTGWVVEAQVTLDDGRIKVIARSPPRQRSRVAQRCIILYLAQQFLPNELVHYCSLQRSDVFPSDMALGVERLGEGGFEGGAVFQSTTDMITQVMNLIEDADPALAPLSCSVEEYGATQASHKSEGWHTQPKSRRYRAVLCSQAVNVISERVGTEDESAVGVLCSALRAVTNRLAGAKGEQLWTEYECHAPPPIATSRELSLYMFNAFFGDVPPAGCLQIDTSSKPVKGVGTLWKGTASLCINGQCVQLAEAYASSKRDAAVHAAILACRLNFSDRLQWLLRKPADSTEGVQLEVAHEVLEQKILTSVEEAIEAADADSRGVMPSAFDLLRHFVAKEYHHSRVVEARVSENGDTTYTCELFILSNGSVEMPPHQISQAVGATASEARGQASMIALQTMFKKQYEAVLVQSKSP